MTSIYLLLDFSVLDLLVGVFDDFHSHDAVFHGAEEDLHGLLVIDRGDVDAIDFQDFVASCEKSGLNATNIKTGNSLLYLH